MHRFQSALVRLAIIAALIVTFVTGAVVPRGTAVAAPRPGVRHVPLNYGHVHILPRHGYARQLGLGSACPSPCNLQNYGGPTMGSSTTYAIFWLPSGQHFESAATDASDTNYENLIKRYFSDIGTNNFSNIVTQYPGTSSTSDTSTFGGAKVETNAYPHAGTQADPLTDGDIQAEATQGAADLGVTPGPGNMFFVFTASGIQSCSDTAKTNCTYTKYCAYHSYFGSGPTIYANMPDAYSMGDCDGFQPNGDIYADTEINVTSHEHMEAITDPQPTSDSSGNTVSPTAWIDASGQEIGDKCAYNYGPGVNPDGSNFILNGHEYRMQQEWSNAVNGCATSLCGTSVCGPSMHFNLSAAPSAISGNPGDDIAYTLSYSNSSGTDPATATSITDALPSTLNFTSVDPPGIFPSGVSPLTWLLGTTGAVGVGQQGTITFHATPNSTLNSSIVNNARLSFSDELANVLTPITGTVTTDIVNSPPTLTVPTISPTSDYNDPLSFTISASDANATDTLTLSQTGLPAGLTLTQTGNGTATVSGAPSVPAGTYPVQFSVSDAHNPAVTALVNVVVTHEESTLTYTGDTVIASGRAATLSARLQEDGTTPIIGRSVTLSLGSGTGLQACTVTTDASGVATCTIIANQTLGSVPVGASFSGDPYYLGSSDTGKQAIVFAYLAAGTFTLGDLSVAAASPTTTLMWWGDTWSSMNSLSRGGTPPSFKGFGNQTSTSPPVCGGNFQTTPGNSPPPPATVPSYMAVAVTDKVTKAGSKIVSGTITKIVVVKTSTGYGPSPSQFGTGTVVATVCHL